MTNDDFTAIAYRPAELSSSERADCIRIVQQGSAVNPKSAAYELPRAVRIAVLRAGAELRSWRDKTKAKQVCFRYCSAEPVSARS